MEKMKIVGPNGKSYTVPKVDFDALRKNESEAAKFRRELIKKQKAYK